LQTGSHRSVIQINRDFVAHADSMFLSRVRKQWRKADQISGGGKSDSHIGFQLAAAALTSEFELSD
jgi:hypothetical protein